MEWHRKGLLNGYIVNDKGGCLFDTPMGNLLCTRPAQNMRKRKEVLENSVNPAHGV